MQKIIFIYTYLLTALISGQRRAPFFFDDGHPMCEEYRYSPYCNYGLCLNNCDWYWQDCANSRIKYSTAVKLCSPGYFWGSDFCQRTKKETSVVYK